MTGKPVLLPQMSNNHFLPPSDYVIIDGHKYKINADFRNWISIIEKVSDSKLSLRHKLCVLLTNGYVDELPPNIDTAISSLIEFMNRGKTKSGTVKSNSSRLFDFTADEGLIYAAFMQQYGIDLYRTNMHWHEFCTLFSALDENCAFMKVVFYRSIDCSKIKNEEKKKFYRKMKSIYKLDSEIDDETIADALFRL